jgi:transcriptional regulator with XRE-family HTH domain
MGTSQSAVARLESGRSPSLTSLRKYAKATGNKVEIRLSKAHPSTGSSFDRLRMRR